MLSTWDKLIQIKKCFIRIKNADDLCCARVIVTAKARLEENAKWESIRHGGNLQTVLAENLHKEADVFIYQFYHTDRAINSYFCLCRTCAEGRH